MQRKTSSALLVLVLALPAAGQMVANRVSQVPAAGPTCADLTTTYSSDLMGHWRFEEDDAPPGEDRLDETANNNDLTVTGSIEVSTSTGVKEGFRAVDHTDVTGDLNRLDTALATNTPGKNGGSTAAASWGGWFYPTASTAGIVFGKQQLEWRIAITTGPKWRCAMTNASSTQFLADADGNLSYNTQYHVWCNWSGSTLVLYVNGVAQADTESVSSMLHSTGALAFLSGAGNDFDGYVDESAVFKRSLTAAEIACIYTDGLDAGGYP